MFIVLMNRMQGHQKRRRTHLEFRLLAIIPLTRAGGGAAAAADVCL
jgi:hypothetical protein